MRVYSKVLSLIIYKEFNHAYRYGYKSLKWNHK